MNQPQAVYSGKLSLIPSEFGKRLQTRARQSTLLKLENFIELRDFVSENEDAIAAQGWENFHEEAGDWMDYSGESVSKGLDIIRAHPEANLRRWMSGGLSFDHIENANSLQNSCHFTAEQLLDAAIDFGNQNGKRMTVRELKAFALGENVPLPPTYDIIKTLQAWVRKLPSALGWDKTKTAEFIKAVDELIKRFL